MKQLLYTIVALTLVIAGCNKDEPVPTEGTQTISNNTYKSTTYYIYGFSFSQAKEIATTTTPGPDIAVYVNVDNPLAAPRLYLAANNLRPSFSKVGDYPDQAAAQTAFDNLKSITATQWTELADPVTRNQIWLYRSGQDTYTKFRIIDIVIDKRYNAELDQNVDYGEITFEWVHQPDESLMFP